MDEIMRASLAPLLGGPFVRYNFLSVDSFAYTYLHRTYGRILRIVKDMSRVLFGADGNPRHRYGRIMGSSTDDHGPMKADFDQFCFFNSFFYIVVNTFYNSSSF